MSMMQFASRTLLSPRKLASVTLTRLYDAQKKMGIRRRRLELMKPSSSVPCYKALRRSENRCNQPRLKLLIDECLEPCDLAPLPMDLDHYTPSEKDRKYQRTWCESYVLPKKFVSVKKSYPNRPRRKLRRVATSFDCVEALNTKGLGRIKPEKLVEITCAKTGKMICCKIPAPGCKRGREDASCGQDFPPSCCKKRRTQYPSFSECQPVGLLDPIPPCECEKKAHTCDGWAYWRRFHKTNK